MNSDTGRHKNVLLLLLLLLLLLFYYYYSITVLHEALSPEDAVEDFGEVMHGGYFNRLNCG